MFALLFIPISAICQKSNAKDSLFKRNTIYIEAFGQGFNSSLSVDHLFSINKKVKTSFTTGLIIVPKSEGFYDGSYYGVALSYNFLFGKGSHKLELGIGLTHLSGEGNIWNDLYTFSYLIPKIGYRFQKNMGGIFFRATFTPMFALINTYDFAHIYHSRQIQYFTNVLNLGSPVFLWGGLSIGWTFKK
jgi:hypothetical protein